LNRNLIREVVYILLQLVPPGKVTTYSSIAKVVGKSPRTIARILRENKDPIVVPCHRVIYKSGEMGGYAFGGSAVKRRLLEIEGVKVVRNKVDKKHVVDIEDLLEKGEVVKVDIDLRDP
jgi:methylated-DNA-[protein]-cysteine S-methyltransferase